MDDTPITPEDLSDYIGDKLMGAGVSMLVIITIVYILFNISRIFCAEKNHWEVWTIYPLGYLASAGLCISDIGQYLTTPHPAQFSSILCD